MHPELRAWHHLASWNKKYASGYQNNKLWSHKALAGCPKSCYFMSLSKLIKRSDKLFYCFQTIHILDHYFVYH